MSTPAVTKAMVQMIDFYKGNHHDIDHFMKVYTFAKTIGEMEGLDDATQELVELTAIVHDIACPLCREKYGSASGDKQEAESAALLEPFFSDIDIPQTVKNRISFIVCHHHTTTGVEGIDWRIMLEADYLVNAAEQKQSPEAIRAFKENVFRTESGLRLLHSIYNI